MQLNQTDQMTVYAQRNGAVYCLAARPAISLHMQTHSCRKHLHRLTIHAFARPGSGQWPVGVAEDEESCKSQVCFRARYRDAFADKHRSDLDISPNWQFLCVFCFVRSCVSSGAVHQLDGEARRKLSLKWRDRGWLSLLPPGWLFERTSVSNEEPGKWQQRNS